MTPQEIKSSIGLKPYYEEKAGVIYHGSCLDLFPFIPPGSIDLIITSPPYNVGMEYESIMPWPDYFELLKSMAIGSMACLRDGGIMAINLPKEVRLQKESIKENGFRVVRIAEEFDSICTKEVGFLPRENVVWVKAHDEGYPFSHVSATSSDNNIYIRSTCEIITLHSKGRYYYDGGTGRRGVEAVPFQDETKDIWWIRPDRSDYHPCPFPIEIPDRLIRLFTLTRKHTPIVFDFCLGSGTTAVAAKQLNRFYIGIDTSEAYCKISAQRLSQGVMVL